MPSNELAPTRPTEVLYREPVKPFESKLVPGLTVTSRILRDAIDTTVLVPEFPSSGDTSPISDEPMMIETLPTATRVPHNFIEVAEVIGICALPPNA